MTNEDKKRMNTKKQIAMDRVHILFRTAKQIINKDPNLAQYYIKTARKIAMRARLKLPREYKRLICQHCKSFILPGFNCHVRIQPRRESHVVITCFQCGEHSRIPIKNKKIRKISKYTR